ncbi:MAG: hypothetical protein CVV47_04315 [Spirochaetae bacterium HGW-Spirochaetae-3]|jgi:hypothetical protein|nr:MAG: hypothetical protein CVV47_04315 [Spirochaetae bacterium HGW-Spirochaetae-3]
MSKSRYAAALAAITFSAAIGAFGQEEAAQGVLDELFDQPVSDTVVSDTGIDHTDIYGPDERLVFGGYFRALGGAIAGYRDWPSLDDLSDNFDLGAGVVAETVVSIDARPSSIASIHGSFGTKFDPASEFNWGKFNILELYGDYILADAMFFRVGQFESVWGQGRIFNPGNLMDDSDDSFTIRAAFPAFLKGVTTYAFGSGDVQSTEDLSYAAKMDLLVLDTYLSGGLLYRYADGYAGLWSIKKVILGADLFSDVVVRYSAADELSCEGIAGFFKEWDRLRLYGEYYVAATESGLSDQKLGLALGVKDIFKTKIDFAMKWEQSLDDGSGIWIGGITWSPLKYITANIGLPVVYGDVGTYYVDTGYVDTEDEDLEVGLDGYRVGLIVTLLMKISF